ncbi:MAG: ATP-binding cassette domain-containing protein [Thermodesulfobacteriaceae bacterium]|nr:ATP-binding cassette domain-containing protein [Thermodesulfobacteriaceae bacterium]MCX8041980.1 ATP-binding cassette domain-containing protein [Thermodesulfobacteriaceae bacterium]MDW8136391.1 ATP-binding cassette domain-containing protein [Thermodesulfobacterium sp.]
MSFIRLEKINKIYPPYFRALVNINLEIEKGDFLLITGPTGAGKTTLLKLIYREEKPSHGEIFIKNKPYSKIKEKEFRKLRQRWGIIFQDGKLFEDLSVYENIKLSLVLAEKKMRDMKHRIYEFLERFNLLLKINKKIKELSGGEQQKVGVIRAILKDPEFLIADEPTGNLDPMSIYEIINILKELHQKGTTIVLATHDPTILNLKIGKLITLEKGELIEGCYFL